MKQMMQAGSLKAALFDLDGTLLGTLDDLAASTNAALAAHGMPHRTTDEVRRFVGNGVAKLIERAVPQGTPEDAVREVLASFVAHYREHDRDTTAPYPGIIAMLDGLVAHGVKCAVISNKIEPSVKALCAAYFGDRVCAAVGDAPERPVKPAPDGVYEAMRRMGVAPQACIYIGDSDVDIYTGHNAGLPSVGVTWGFRSEALLREAGADFICHDAQELLDLLTGLCAEEAANEDV